MKFDEIFESQVKYEGNTYDFRWDQKREGFVTLENGKEKGFFKAKSFFDRSEAQEEAKKLMIKLRSDHVTKVRAADEYEYQYNKPLSKLEQEWAEMTNRFMSLTDKELARWEQLWKSGVIRKSLMDDSHPAITRGKNKNEIK